MIGNLIKCEGCGRELQPENIGVDNVEVDGEYKLVRICRFCGHQEVVK